MHRTTSTVAICLLAIWGPATALAEVEESPEPRWELVAAPFALHWASEADHRHVVLLGLEKQEPGNVLWGGAAFRNSFGQPSAYAYYGRRWDQLFGSNDFYLKLSGGVIYGYKGRYKDKVPFNHHGFGLAVIPALGFQITRNDALQIGFLGTAAAIFTYSRRF